MRVTDCKPLNPRAPADINKVRARDHEGEGGHSLSFSCFIFSYLKKKML